MIGEKRARKRAGMRGKRGGKGDGKGGAGRGGKGGKRQKKEGIQPPHLIIQPSHLVGMIEIPLTVEYHEHSSRLVASAGVAKSVNAPRWHLGGMRLNSHPLRVQVPPSAPHSLL